MRRARTPAGAHIPPPSGPRVFVRWETMRHGQPCLPAEATHLWALRVAGPPQLGQHALTVRRMVNGRWCIDQCFWTALEERDRRREWDRPELALGWLAGQLGVQAMVLRDETREEAA